MAPRHLSKWGRAPSAPGPAPFNPAGPPPGVGRRTGRSGMGPPVLAALVAGMFIGAGLLWLWQDRQGGGSAALPQPTGSTANATVCFTPGEPCTELIASILNAARREILVQAYSFTSRPIATALEAAKRRGVDVRVILDDSQLPENVSLGDEVRAAGIPVWVDDPAGIAHNKVMVVDREVVITGSFNFSRAAQERNAENLLVLRDPALAARYAANWERRLAVSQRYEEARRRAANDNARPSSAKRPALRELF